MKNVIAFLVTLMVMSCGPKPEPKPPTPKPKVMSFKVKGKTILIKAKMKDAAKYQAVDAKKQFLNGIAALDNK